MGSGTPVGTMAYGTPVGTTLAPPLVPGFCFFAGLEKWRWDRKMWPLLLQSFRSRRRSAMYRLRAPKDMVQRGCHI
jgi:hypothetical protein